MRSTDITETDVEATLRSHKLDATKTKSTQREEAEACHQRKGTASR